MEGVRAAATETGRDLEPITAADAARLAPAFGALAFARRRITPHTVRAWHRLGRDAGAMGHVHLMADRGPGGAWVTTRRALRAFIAACAGASSEAR